MADRRMFAKSIVLSDAFLDMPMSARCLYFTLGIVSDDDGVVGNPKAVMRQCGASIDDMNVLLSKRYVLGFESGVIVIKHWRINNYIREDRHKSTTYVEELATLTTDEKGAYTEKNKVGIPFANQLTTTCQPTDNQVRANGIPSIGKVSIDKDNNILSDTSDVIKQIIDHINKVVGSHYTYRCKSTNEKIKARIKEGHTVDEFITVIDKKYAQWGNDPKMSPYLRPETLFSASHFESYLNEIAAKPKQAFSNERKYNYAELEQLAKGG